MKLKAISLNTAQASPSNATGEPGGSSAQANPFVGLRPFESTESLLFFGRREQTVELLQLLHDARFLSIVGSSGCGKSSLIRAGLIPKLKAGFLAGERDQWRIATMKPGDAPLQNLSSALLEAFSEEPLDKRVTSMAEDIRDSGLQAILDYLSVKLSTSSANVLLLVDQFEEIFRFGLYADKGESQEASDDVEQRRDEAADFVSLMLQLAQQGTLPVYVVMTMRSDFLGDCDAFHGLPEAMNRSQYLVPRLTRQQRQEAIESPIRLYGADITPRLLDRVLNDVGDESDQLPVMQHALMRTWEKWQEQKTGPLDLPHYEAIGMIKEALSRDADKALEGMSEEELFIAERLFQALTDTDVKGRRLRRPVHLSDIEAITGADRPAILEIIERFRSSNRSFLTLSQDRIENDPLIDISHESLIRQWKTLRTWTDAEAESKELYLRLAGDAIRYSKKQVPLWSDPALQFALEWRTNRQPNEAWARRYHPDFQLAMGFLSESEEHRDRINAEAESRREAEAKREREELERAQQYAEQQRLFAEERAAAQERELKAAQDLVEQQKAFAERQAVAAKRLRWLTVALGLLCILSVSAVIFAVSALDRAKKSQRVAEENQKKAEENQQTADRLKDEAEIQAGREKGLKEDAEKQKGIADENKDKAVKAQNEAVAAKKKTEEALVESKKQAARAESEKSVALEAKRQAEIAKAAAETARRQADEALAHAKETQAADQLHRKATKEEEAANLEQAKETYRAAIYNYNSLGDFDGVAYTYTELARMLLRQSRSVEGSEKERDEGLSYYKEAIKVYRSLRDFNGSASALAKVGDYYSRSEEDDVDFDFDESNIEDKNVREPIEKGFSNYCQALGDYRNANNNLDGQIKVLVKIGDLVRRQLANKADEEEQKRKAWLETISCGDVKITAQPLDYYRQTFPLYESLMKAQGQEWKQLQKYRRAFSSLLIKTATFSNESGDTAGAKEMFERAVKVSSDESLERKIETLMEIGENISGDLKDNYYQQAARAAEAYRKDKPEKEAEVLSKIGQRYISSIAFRTRTAASPVTQNKGLAYYEQALKIYEGLGNKEKQYETMRDIAITYYYQGQKEEALTRMQRVAESYHVQGNTKNQALSLYTIGYIQAELGKLKEALDSYSESLKLYSSVPASSMSSSDSLTFKAIPRRIEELKKKLQAQPTQQAQPSKPAEP